MRTLILLFIGLLMLQSCNQPKNISNQEIEDIKINIETLMNNWHKDAAETNYNQYFELMDSNSYFIGTDATEHWTKQQFEDFCKPYFDKGRAWDFKTIERNIYVSKAADVVWFDELLDTWMGICRGSGVLAKSNNTWKLQHYVLSIAIPNEDVEAVIDAKINTDSVLINEINQ